MRGIPSLQTLCLRSVGGKQCNADDVFAPGEDGSPSKASRLLRSFQLRASPDNQDGDTIMTTNANDSSSSSSSPSSTWSHIPLTRIPSIGNGSARRQQASDVDLNHPWIAVIDSSSSSSSSSSTSSSSSKSTNNKRCLVGEYNSPSLDVLQSYIDALVELSRMDDSRLGLHFFAEWKANVQAKQGLDAIDPPKPRRKPTSKKENEPTSNTDTTTTTSTVSSDEVPPTRPTKRIKLSISPKNSSANLSKTATSSTPPLGSLSLHNTVLHLDTIEAMMESGMAQHLGVLDLTGIQTLNDSMLGQILRQAPHLERLSLKNCRRITSESLETLRQYSHKLEALDIGGSYNMTPSRILELAAALSQLQELHVSGLPWDDEQLFELTSLRGWRALSLGYLLPRKVSQEGLKRALASQSESLQSLALPFCEHLVDAALIGNLGRHLPNVQALDVRGNAGLNSLTGWYDGRATLSPVPPPQPLLVLGRYSGLAKANIDDTKRIHPIQASDLVCHLDSGGVGEGIQRVSKNPNNL